MKPIDCKYPGSLDVGKPEELSQMKLITNGVS